MENKEKFTWLPFFNELFHVVCEKYNKDTIVNLLYEVFADKKILQDVDENGQKIIQLSEFDPLSFIAELNIKREDPKRINYCNKVKEILNLKSEAPSDFTGIPTFNNQKAWFFGDKSESINEFNILWNFSLEIHKKLEINENLFNLVLNIDNVGITKLSQFIFIIFPQKYYPMDSKTLSLFPNFKKEQTFECFKNFQKEIIKNEEFKNMKPYELSDYVYKHNLKNMKKKDDMKTENIKTVIEKFITQSLKNFETGLGNGNRGKGIRYKDTVITIGYGFGDVAPTTYIAFLNYNQTVNNGIYPVILYTKDSKILEVCYGISVEKEPKYEWDKSFIQNLSNSITTKYANSFVKNSFKIENNEDIKNNIDNIVSSVDIVINDFHKNFSNMNDWNNDEKSNEQKYNIKNIQPLNQILYGPPGTGKTYNTVIKAMEIINKNKIKYDDNNNILNYKELEEEFNKLKQSKQIEFITFHQSYSYEEFIEGIKPDIKEWETENKDITYIGKDGILKDISNSAKSELIKNIAKNNIDLEKINIFKMSLGNTKDDNDTNIFEYCIKNNVVAIGYGNDINFSECKSENDLEKFLNQQENNDNKKSIISRMNVFRFVLKNDDLILVSNGNKNIRAIAQVDGEYFFNDKTEINYNHFRKVKWLYNGENISTNTMLNEKQLSQKSIYKFNKEDINFTFLNQILNPSKDYKPKPYILIIDEINRGNISKIFGEMITLIEEDKRLGNEHELKLTLPYSKEPFGIPNNLYIIGTMNTSDRSIASVDIALRRRFKFIEMMPKSDLVTDILIKDENKSISFKYIFEALNEKITILLDRDHQIGHSYFLKEKINSIYDLQSIWFDEILPLLNEYFYNDWYKLQALLGEAELKKDNNEQNSSFIVKNDLSKYKMKDIDKEDKFIFNFVDRDKVNFQQALLKIIEPVKNNVENKEVNSDEQENN